MQKYGTFFLAFVGISVGGLLILSGASGTPQTLETPAVQEPPVVQKQPAHVEQPKEEPRITLSSATIPQGETLVVELSDDVTSLSLNAERVPFSEVGNRTFAVIGFDTRATTGTRTLTFESAHGASTTTFEVIKKEYTVTRIVVPPSLVAKGVTSGDLAASIAKSDNVALSDIVAIETEKYHFLEPFVEPTDEWVDVGAFGAVREDKNGSIRHLGVDLDGKTGDPVYATNRGVVVYAGALQNYGNSVVIDHGLGIFSIYLHLSSIQTSAGATVAGKERIGSIGNTGAYTLAPHLHFSIKVRGVSVDPGTFISMFNSVISPDR
jgi:murein DD-endopeptidase MepM/ murein hydrolase activator NlpD